MNESKTAQPVPFSLFVDLLASIASIPRKCKSKDAPIDRFGRWAKFVRGREGGVPPETGVVLFRLLFPQEDTRRRYNLKETRLACMLCDVLGVPTHSNRGKALRRWGEWTDGSEMRPKTGCLGDEVKEITSAIYTDRQGPGISIHRVDELLDELASHSGFSQMSQQPFHKRTEPRPQRAILREMYTQVTPHEAAFLTQIILQDLRPVLYPLPIVNTTWNLLYPGPKDKRCELGLYHTMRSWHVEMPRVYRLCASLDQAARAIESGPPYPTSPTLFKPVAIPKCYKGRSSTDVLNQFFNRSSKVYAETKYDGERMQIHVDLFMDIENQIRIFSKSKRDSTMDRYATLPIIRAALGLPQAPNHSLGPTERLPLSSKPSIRSSVILEAEMVAYSERTHAIDEFWRIRGLIQSTSKSVRRRTIKSQHRPLTLSREDSSSDSETEGLSNSQSREAGYSLKSDGTDEGTRHFLLVFFDILHIDGQNLLDETYQTRRRKLEGVVQVIEGFTCLAARTCIDLHGEDPFQALTRRFSQAIAQFEEGLVLKSEESKYNAPSDPPWVKLKKDYIPGLGDTLDMCVVGAAYDKDRARDLGVGTDTFTTFYVAALSKKPVARQERPRFQCLFTVSYGLGRKELEQLNFEIKYKGVCPWESRDLNSLSYLVDLSPGIQAPDILFATPALFEVYGGGFDKAPGCRYYQLRWPRIKKVWRPEERNWGEGETLENYCKKSYVAVGRDPSKKELDISVANMWRTQPLSSPPARSLTRRRTAEGEWFERLQEDKPLTRSTRSTPAFPSHVKSACAAVDPIRSTKPLRTTTANVTIVEAAVTEQLDVPVVSPSKEHPKNTTPPSSGKRKRPQDSNLSHPSPSKRPRTRATRESTLISNPIHPTLALCWQPGSGEIPLSMFPTPHLLTQKVSSPHSANVRKHDVGALPLHLLIEDAFLLVYRPIYPIIRRPKGKPALSTLLPAERLLNTLDALLIGCGWSVRRTPVPKGIERGVVFVDTSDGQAVATLIQTLHSKQELKITPTHAGQPKEILVLSKEYLNYFYSYSGGRTIDGQAVKVEFIWTSECKAPVM